MIEHAEPTAFGESTQPETEAEPASYHIQLSQFQDQGRSFSFLMRQRMCKQSLAKLGEEIEQRIPVEDAKTKKVRFETRTSRYGDDPIAVIQECCSQTSHFRAPQLPLKEILFRILLAGGNQPKTAEKICNEVLEWIGFSDGRVITPESIQRLLERDDYYGFVRVASDDA